MNGVTFKVDTKDQASPTIRRVTEFLGSKTQKTIFGRSARNSIRAHFFRLNSERPNQMGGRRTNFFAQVGRSVQAPAVEGDSIVIGVTHVGIRQRIYGGTIVPKNAKFLTVPADPSAYGRRAKEFKDLRPIFFRGAQVPGALVTKDHQVMYWLVKQVKQKGDTSILPKSEDIIPSAFAAVRNTLERLRARNASTGEAES